MADKKADLSPLDQAPAETTPPTDNNPTVATPTPPPAYEVVGIPASEVYVMALYKTFDLRKLTAAEIKELQAIKYEHIKVAD